MKMGTLTGGFQWIACFRRDGGSMRAPRKNEPLLSAFCKLPVKRCSIRVFMKLPARLGSIPLPCRPHFYFMQRSSIPPHRRLNGIRQRAPVTAAVLAVQLLPGPAEQIRLRTDAKGAERQGFGCRAHSLHPNGRAGKRRVLPRMPHIAQACRGHRQHHRRYGITHVAYICGT